MTSRRHRFPLVGRQLRRLALAVLLAVCQPPADGHPDTWHTIDLLTERLTAGDQRAALFYARATEYRIVEKWREAEADLRRCLQRDPGFFQARLDLGPVLLAAGRKSEALAAAREAAQTSDHQSERNRAAAWASVARMERATENWTAVLAATDTALRWLPQGEVDWYLLREEAFRRQGRLAEAVEDLAKGEAALHSSRLRLASIDALIDTGRPAEALPLIEKAMAETPFHSPLLVRRGRARAALGQLPEARADWESALVTVEARLVPEEPDPGLLVVKGMALAELGRHIEAHSALSAARTLFPDPSLIGPLERLLHSKADPPAAAPVPPSPPAPPQAP